MEGFGCSKIVSGSSDSFFLGLGFVVVKFALYLTICNGAAEKIYM